MGLPSTEGYLAAHTPRAKERRDAAAVTRDGQNRAAPPSPPPSLLTPSDACFLFFLGKVGLLPRGTPPLHLHLGFLNMAAADPPFASSSPASSPSTPSLIATLLSPFQYHRCERPSLLFLCLLPHHIRPPPI
uniref:Uncharacterized protein n=1 Tax=Triticum urartu TaxID=4572 RepID=A0A8R7JYB5_TRIUA